MNNKLKIINDSIQEIREMLDANCVSVNDLPEFIGDVIVKSGAGGFTTSFVFSSESNPDIPSGGKLNLTTGLVEGVEGPGYQTAQPRSVSNSYMSFAIFDHTGDMAVDWSKPMSIKGANGLDGQDGKDGVPGPAGIPGEKGDVGIGYRTVSAYTTTDSIYTKPKLPKGGYGNVVKNEVEIPKAEDGTQGYDNVDKEENPKKFTGTTSATFSTEGLLISEGGDPIRITGDDGQNGADGTLTEFIYRLLPNRDAYKKLLDYLRENPLSNINEKDYVPDTLDFISDKKGVDRAQGITEEWRVEVFCNRVKKSVDSPGGPWSRCGIGSSGGEDGMDGDGIEYIYLITPDTTYDNEPITSNYVQQFEVPNYDINSEEYQKDGFCFNENYGFSGYKWTDEPKDVGPGEPMEGVMVRKQHEGKWQEFSKPALGATYSEAGVSYITSFVFTRANIENPPEQPKGGNYVEPWPTTNGKPIGQKDVTGSDSIIPGTNPVWMSMRSFCSNSEYNDPDGSDPKILADSADFEVEYSADPNVTGDQITKFTGDRKEGRAVQPFKWGDDSEITDPVGMITATRHGGIWSDGVLSRIKGEKGDKGEPGSSVMIEGQFETEEELIAAGDHYVRTGSVEKFYFESKDGTINQGDGGYILNKKLLYSYSGGGSEGQDPNFGNYGFTTDIQGKPGDSAYLYIAYCDTNDPSATLYFDTPKRFIGIKATTEPLSPEAKNSWYTYAGIEWKGQDGGGQEQIFLATSKTLGYDFNNHLPLPVNNPNGIEFLPTHNYGSDAYPNDRGSDTPVSISEEYPYCGVASRKRAGDKFENGSGYNGKATLYSRHSYDGKNAVKVDLTNDLAVIPLENGEIDKDFKDEVYTYVKVYIGDEEIYYPNFTIQGNEHITVENNKIVLKKESLTKDITSIPIVTSVNDVDYSTTGHLFYTDVVYELIPDTYVLKRYIEGEYTGLLEKDTLNVSILKGRDNTGESAVIPIFAEVLFTDKTAPKILSTSDNEIIISQNGVATIPLNGLKNVSEIKVYAVAKDKNGDYTSNGTVITYETITIVSDGATGKSSGRTVFIYTKSESNEVHYVSAPRGGYWDFNTHQMLGMESTDKHVGSGKSANPSTAQPFIGQCTGEIDYNGQLIGSWDHPYCITGAAGADGTSLNIQGSFSTLDELKTEGSNYIKDPSRYTGSFKMPLLSGDCYRVETNNHLGTYYGSGVVFEDAGMDLGNIQGESSKIYIRFSKFSNGNPMEPEGDVGPFIGIVATDPDRSDLVEFLADYKNYDWTKWTGDDGFGQEQIFCYTTKYDAPLIPSDWEHKIDDVPNGGTDKPISADKDHPYIGYVTRNTRDGTAKGDKDNPGYAALYTQHAAKGNDAIHLELTNDQCILPLEGDKIDPDFIANYTAGTKMILYSGDSELTTNVTYKVDLPSLVDETKLKDGTVVLNLNNIGDVSEIKCIATHNLISYTKTFHIVKTKNAYEIITDKVVLERDPITGYLVDTDKSLTVSPKKGDGQHGTDLKGKTLFVIYYYINGTTSTSEISLDTIGQGKLDLDEVQNLSKIKLYLTENDNENDSELCFEEIGIVANGVPGESSYSSQLSNYADIVSIQDGKIVGFPITASWVMWHGSEDITNNATITVSGNDHFQVNLDTKGTIIIDNEDLPTTVGRYTLDFTIEYDDVLLNETMTIIVQQAGGESATGIDVLNNYTNAIIELGEVSNTISTSIQAYYGTSTDCKITNVEVLDIDGNSIEGYTSTINGNICSIVLTDLNVITFEEGANTGSTINLQINATYTYDGKTYNGSTIWTIVASKTKLPYLVLTPNAVNFDSDEKTITIRCADPVSGDLLDYNGGTEKGGQVTIDDGVLESDSYTVSEVKEVNIKLLITSFIVDSETVPVLKNGENSISYTLYSSIRSVHYTHDNQLINASIADFMVYKKDGLSVTKGLPSELGCKIEAFIDDAENANLTSAINDDAKLDFSELNSLPSGWREIRVYLYPPEEEEWSDYAQIDALYGGPPGEKGDGIASVAYKYLISDVSDETTIKSHADSFVDNRPAITELTSDKPYLGCQETTIYTNGDKNVIYYIETVGGKGETGRSAPLIYPAGVWDDGKQYVVSPSKVPYVGYESSNEDEKGYYKAKDVDSEITFSGKAPTDTEYWEQMEYMESIYSDIGAFNQALVGKGVFHGDYMFSQEGVGGYYTNADGEKYRIGSEGSILSEESGNYSVAVSGSLYVTTADNTNRRNEEYTTLINQMPLYEMITNGYGTPTICFNAVTGEGNLKDVIVEKVNTHTIIDGVDKSIVIENGELISHNGDDAFGKVIVGNNDYGNKVNVPMLNFDAKGSVLKLNPKQYINIGFINSAYATGEHTIHFYIKSIKIKSTSDSVTGFIRLLNNGSWVYEIEMDRSVNADESGYYNFNFYDNATPYVKDINFNCNNVDKFDIALWFSSGASGVTLSDLEGDITSYIYTTPEDITNTYLGNDGLTIAGPKNIIKMSEENTIIMYGLYGIKISYSGIEKTNDAGKNWTSL